MPSHAKAPSKRFIRTHYDVIVVGARCAGAATAMLLARGGLHVLNVDKGQAGTDTLSTHALMRGGVLQLQRWGLLDGLIAQGASPIDTTTFHYGSEQFEVNISPRYGVDKLYAPRRHLLDATLADAARATGADVRHRTSLVGLLRATDGRVIGVRLRDADGRIHYVTCRLVIGADGVRSKLAELVDAPIIRKGRHASGTIYCHYEDMDTRGYHWHFAPGLTAGAIPTNRGQTCVFVGFAAARFAQVVRSGLSEGFQRCLEQCAPRLSTQVRSATPISNLRAYAGSVGFTRRSTGPGWALVGDASYYKDPGTSHGMTDAFRDAELLARAVLRGRDPLGRYQAERDELCRHFAEVTDQVASCHWSFDELKRLHREVSREMNREAAFIAAWDANRLSPERSHSLIAADSRPVDSAALQQAGTSTTAPRPCD